ncbi:MAG: PQQ-binding-like beta-propeller repeat protein [Phycisphaerae bacterium]|nr:PQQ-binding-like beta-propeller repeat protein [Phycisphaerae bacterium]
MICLCTAVQAANWPQWRGPQNNGVSAEDRPPLRWGESKNVLWKLALPGRAGSTPAVWGDRIFLTSAEGKEGLVLVCASTSGKLLWKRKISDGNRGHSEGNRSSPSPSTDGKHVWAFYGTGDLVCYDLAGEKVWSIDIQDRYGKFRLGFGMHMTPVLHDGRLYLQLIHSGGAQVVALDANSGREIWKRERPSDGVAECEHSYASPVIWSNGRSAYLVTHGNDYAVAHGLNDGREIWRLGDLNPKSRYNRTLRFVASPVAAADLIVVPSAKNGPVVGVKPDARGMISDGNKRAVRWWRPKNTPDVPSPLIYDGMVYLCRENGVLICLDAATGQEYYTQSVHRRKHRASPVAAGGRVYLTGDDGTVSVVKAGRTYELLAQNKVDDQTLASPVIVGGRVYIRGFASLYAIGER